MKKLLGLMVCGFVLGAAAADWNKYDAEQAAAQNGVLRVTVPAGVKIALKKLD